MTTQRATYAPPRLVIELRLEERPRVLKDVRNDGEERRLTDWLESHQDLCELVNAALRLERAA